MGKNFAYATVTDPGKRPVNEDAIGVFRDRDMNCFVLCDGLGGHGMGEVASGLTVEVFRERFSKIGEPEDFLGQSFEAAQDVLLAEQLRRNAKQKMKTTATAVITCRKGAYIGHVGDSRVYVFSKNKVLKRTLDHSVPQMLALSGEIREEEIRKHPDRSKVLRVLGVEWEKPQYSLMDRLPLRKCQAFLLCSDGFWELITEEKMCETLEKADTVESWLDSMVRTVKENGAGTDMDNFSAIAVWKI